MNYNRVRGRYGGGVRVADGYYLGRKYLKPDQTNYTIKGEITWKQGNSTEYDVC